MKRFVYTFHEGKPPRDGSGITYTCHIYEIKRNAVLRVATGSDTHVSEAQLVMETLEKHKLLPRKAFERSPIHNCMIHGNLWSLKEAGIACITRIS